MLLWHDGTPGSTHQLAYVADAAHVRGWRLITMSPAGYTASTRAAGRSVADVVPEASAVLDALGLDDALGDGVSGGVRTRSRPCHCRRLQRRSSRRGRLGLPGLDGPGQRRGVRARTRGCRRLRPYLEQQPPALGSSKPWRRCCRKSTAARADPGSSVAVAGRRGPHGPVLPRAVARRAHPCVQAHLETGGGHLSHQCRLIESILAELITAARH